MQLKLRSMFIPEDDKIFIAYDFSQAESWIVAYLANEMNMKYSLKHGDIHLDTAANAIYKVPKEQVTKPMRYMGKKSNHAYAYRMSYMRGAQTINKEADKPPYLTVTNAQMKIVRIDWLQYYSAIKPWWMEIEEALGPIPRILITPYGQVRRFFNAWGDELFKEATAHIPQATVAQHANGLIHPELGIKGGFIEVYNEFVKKERMINIVNQSHDSICVEVHKDNVDDIQVPIYNLLHRPIVVNDEEFTIPVDCEMGDRYGELEKVKIAA